MKSSFSIMLFLISLTAFAQSQSMADNKIDSTNFDKLYPFALRGNMSEVFNMLEKTDNKALTQEQLTEFNGYYERFIYQSEDFDYNTDDEEIIDLYKRFQNYWRSVMIENVPPKLADSLLRLETNHFLKKHFRPQLSVEEINENNFLLFIDYFESKDLHGIAMGKTGHLYDLYLWKEEEEVEYSIDLPEGQGINVPVVFMRDFISNGWSHYTTFGHSFSGGWASSYKLYCVEESYGPRDEEEFLISYVSHEGQHFADYNTFPELKQADLEYRAKLTELSLARETLYDILDKFITNSKNDMQYAHGFANHVVIKELSEIFFKSEFESDSKKWEQIPQKKINKSALRLLKEHSRKLQDLGAESVEAYITRL